VARQRKKVGHHWSILTCGIFQITLLNVIESKVAALDVFTVEKFKSLFVLVKINSILELIKIFFKIFKKL
jgi:hypothetical protein